jgi:hypothetical protein
VSMGGGGTRRVESRVKGLEMRGLDPAIVSNRECAVEHGHGGSGGSLLQTGSP